jgi:acetate kinase
MNSLVLIPRRTGLRYSRISLGAAGQAASSPVYVSDLRGTSASVRGVQAALAEKGDDRPIDVLTIWTVYGGNDFPSSVLVDEDSLARLRRLGGQAPLSVAKTTALIADAQAAFPGTPVALAFETSFFVDLPTRETTYALPGDTGMSVRRWGYHGLFHEAATNQLAWSLGAKERPARMLSICLDPTPEMAAVLGRAPQLVTSGSTPVEGLPGERNCGEIDPAIALALAADPSLGPERANILLTQESGFFGMLGRPVTLGEVLTGRQPRIARVREHLLYRICLAAGSSLAALEGLDGVVFSGPYAKYAEVVAAHLLPRLERTLDLSPGTLPWEICPTPLASIVAEAGLSALLAGSQSRREPAGGLSLSICCSSSARRATMAP